MTEREGWDDKEKFKLHHAESITVALHEFADKGLSGARIDDIAATTRSSKRMI